MLDLIANALIFSAGVTVGGLIMAVLMVGKRGQVEDDYARLIRALDKTQETNRNLRRTNAELAAALHEHHPTH